MHWHVLGAGAMGCLFAAALHRGGQDTTLVLREAPADSEVSLRLEREGGVEEVALPICGSTGITPITHLLVCTKAYDVRQAVKGVAHRLDNSSQVLIMANGMGFSEALQSELPWLDIYHGITTEGAYRVAPWHVVHAGLGQTRIGQAGRTEPPLWFPGWRSALDSCEWEADIQAALWRKLAINCAINPLTALHRCRNGDLARRDDLAAELAGLCHEIARISTAAGYRDIARELESIVMRVVANTADNRSSMLQDVLQNRPTEIEYITGHLVEVADHYGVDAPLNKALLADLRATNC